MRSDSSDTALSYRSRRLRTDAILPEVKFNQLTRTIGALCPTIDVTVNAKWLTGQEVTVIHAEDWRGLKSTALLERLYGDKEKEDLIDVTEVSGEVVGRLTPKIFHHTILTYGGIANGSLEGASGVLLASNNSDLARRDASPIASKEAWRKWASKWLDRKSVGFSATLALHPFCPDRADLRVYRLVSDIVSEEGLRQWLKPYPKSTLSAEVPHTRTTIQSASLRIRLAGVEQERACAPRR